LIENANDLHDSILFMVELFRVNSKPRTSPGFSQSAFLATRIPGLLSATPVPSIKSKQVRQTLNYWSLAIVWESTLRATNSPLIFYIRLTQVGRHMIHHFESKAMEAMEFEAS
jgi:hypothetical protein